MLRPLSTNASKGTPPPAPSARARALARVGKLLLALILIATLALLSRYLPGVDYRPLGWGLELELAGGSAYGDEMQARFAQAYSTTSATSAAGGFAYPLPAIWLALPFAAVPEPFAKAIWCVLALGSVMVGMVRLNMRPQLFLFVPLLWGVSELQVTVLLCGLALLGVWALREQRWWLLGLLIAVLLLTKPQTTLIFGGALALAAYRARAWRPMLLCGLVLLVPTFVLEPRWVQEWLQHAARYTSAHRTMWFIAWLPLAALLLWRRRTWSGLAILQMTLVPVVTHPYTLLPLLVGYVDIRHRWLAWLAVAGAWCSVLLPTLGPLWFFVGLCYLPPLLIDALWEPAPPAQATP